MSEGARQVPIRRPAPLWGGASAPQAELPLGLCYYQRASAAKGPTVHRAGSSIRNPLYWQSGGRARPYSWRTVMTN